MGGATGPVEEMDEARPSVAGTDGATGPVFRGAVAWVDAATDAAASMDGAASAECETSRPVGRVQTRN
jgi:hypothetical protein